LPPQPLVARELSQEKKILLARGAFLGSAEPQFDVLVSLTNDPDEEVSRLAQQTLARLSNDQCAILLAASSLTESVARYFLDPAHVHPTLLPAFLADPASPQDAIEALAARAGAETMAVLLDHLDLLKTGALAALKKNPVYRNWRKAPSSAALPFPLPTSRDDKVALARGAARVPATQRLAVLVSLAADSDAEVRHAAQETLQHLPEEECLEFLLLPWMPEGVARYFLDPARVSPPLLAALLTRPDLPPDAITALAAQAGPEVVRVLLDQLDMLKTPALKALKENPAYLDWQKSPPSEGFVLEADLLQMLIEEVEAEKLVPPTPEPEEEDLAGEDKAEGVFSKIAKMSVAKKVVLALRGNKEERAILIRDGSKVVSRAVLGSPKLTEAEVESFSTQKNVSQDVLRLIAMNRKFIKDYIVVKNLANNPRLPIDLGLALVSRLMPNDVRALAGNRDVADTIRKMAHKLATTRAH
jgi:hypothetical protein